MMDLNSVIRSTFETKTANLASFAVSLTGLKQKTNENNPREEQDERHEIQKRVPFGRKGYLPSRFRKGLGTPLRHFHLAHLRAVTSTFVQL